MRKQPKAKKSKGGISRRTQRVLLIVVAILVIFRIILPYVVLKYANKTLSEMDGYFGHVQDIDIALLRGAYKIKNIYLNKIDSASGSQSPFFQSRMIDLSVQWNALFHGRLVGELEFDHAILDFKKEKVEPDELQKDTTEFHELLKDFMPLKVNRFEVYHGEIHYIDSTTQPVVDIKMDETHILANNLSNVQDTSTSGLPATIIADSHIYGGTLHFSMKMNPLAEQIEFDMNAEVKDTQLPRLNNFFKAYAKVDVNKGTFGMYTELAAKDGKFIGYVKPIIKDLDVLGPEDRHNSFFAQVWEGTVGTVAKLFSNWPKDQLATKIPLKGTTGDTDANIWVTIFEMLRNAFINALRPSLDNEINIETVNQMEPEKKNILQKIFGGKDHKDSVKMIDRKKENEEKEREKKKKEKNDDEDDKKSNKKVSERAIFRSQNEGILTHR
jgi:hypothetical protein